MQFDGSIRDASEGRMTKWEWAALTFMVCGIIAMVGVYLWTR